MQPPNGLDDIYKRLSFGVKRKRLLKETAESSNVIQNAKRLSVSFISGTATQVSSSSLNNPSGSQLIEDESEVRILTNSKLRLKMGKRKEASNDKTDTTQKETVKILRKQNHIFVWGSDVPGPIKEFTDIDALPTTLFSNLSEFGITKPTPVQMQAIPIMLEKREILVSAPTGSGKTLAFALPILLEILRLKGSPKRSVKPYLKAIVLEPTKELAKQVYLQFLKFGQKLPISCALLEDKNVSIEADVLVSTPNRLGFVLETKPSSITKRLKWLVVDEGDRLFDTTEGEERCFRTQLAKIYQICNNSKLIHRAFFSATFSYEVEDWCKQNLNNLAVVCVGARNSAVALVKQDLVFAGNEQGKILGLRTLFHQGFEPPAVVFVQSKDRARQLYSEIEGFRPAVPAALISSEVSEKERESAITRFREGKIWVLVCTDLMGRGLDFRGVNLIVNFDLPTSITSYIHRVGRAGRAGRPGRALTYFTESDLDIIRPIATVIKQAGFPVPDYTLRMRKVSRSARRKLLRHAPQRKRISIMKKKSVRNCERVAKSKRKPKEKIK